MSYKLLGMIPEDFDFDLRDFAERLKKKFESVPDTTIHLDLRAGEILIPWENWSFRIYLAEAPHVLAESRDIAESCGSHRPDRATLAACRRRIEIASDEDGHMDHFNDYLFIIEVLESFPRLILFKPESQAFQDEQ